MFGAHEPAPGELRFPLFGIPVRIHPFFWLSGLFLGYLWNGGLAENLVWMVAFFVGILLHELGHALAIRAYGFDPWIVLYGLGGLACYEPRFYGRRRGPEWLRQVLISAAGPGAGFLLAAAIVGLLTALGRNVELRFGGWPPASLLLDAPDVNVHMVQLVNDLLYVTVAYGILNLLPIHPLDGGQIARAVAVRLDPAQGLRRSLILSFALAVLMAVLAVLRFGSVFSAVLFAMLAYLNYEELQRGC